MIKLGQEAWDIVTGFTGIAIARTEWLNGCVRVTLQPKIDKDGKHQDNQTFDEPQVEGIGPGLEVDGYVRRTTTGGPIPKPSRAKDPV